ncbi:hypothetical protein JTE90_010259 [Oedothorax gibbosus]|uniref:Uncharacterized protein n=1 Tax=Oedothorax gibbosus TaxID=931172 RepID=A0AAV6U6V3_9ARAC|nr:hypothetical protein JTE90_010259 [Oedothorax gibbosus]
MTPDVTSEHTRISPAAYGPHPDALEKFTLTRNYLKLHKHTSYYTKAISPSNTCCSSQPTCRKSRRVVNNDQQRDTLGTVPHFPDVGKIRLSEGAREAREADDFFVVEVCVFLFWSGVGLSGGHLCHRLVGSVPEQRIVEMSEGSGACALWHPQQPPASRWRFHPGVAMEMLTLASPLSPASNAKPPLSVGH